jgi:alkanesulfonate monooxygenase
VDLGLHIADFTWDGGAPAIAPTLAGLAQHAEAGGISRLTVMDHFWQIRGIGPAEHDMLEAYTTLGYLAAHTTTARLHVLVTGVVYHHPAILAKQVSTLDVLTGGRAGLGIGAAWNADESAGLGIPFPPRPERFDRLEEAVQICLQMWSGDEGPFDGPFHHLGRTLNVPQPLSSPRPYLMIGGGGERRTLRLVAQYADACNIGGPEGERKLGVLRAHCDEVGRDYGSIEKTSMFTIDATTTPDDVVRIGSELHRQGFTAAYVYGREMADPRRTVDVLAAALPDLP